MIAISEDDDTIIPSGLTEWGIDEGALRHVTPKHPAPGKILILGWNHRTKTIIRELDSYLARGSRITVVADDKDLPGQWLGDQVKELTTE